MEEMITRWIREVVSEHERAKRNQNLYQMKEMERLLRALREMRDNLMKMST